MLVEELDTLSLSECFESDVLLAVGHRRKDVAPESCDPRRDYSRRVFLHLHLHQRDDISCFSSVTAGHFLSLTAGIYLQLYSANNLSLCHCSLQDASMVLQIWPLFSKRIRIQDFLIWPKQHFIQCAIQRYTSKPSISEFKPADFTLPSLLVLLP